jgi:hypothetical protein
MSDIAFNELYQNALKEVFLERAREQLAEGIDGLTCAQAYAVQGKPDFTLAHLLLAEDVSDEEKRELLAHAYEQRAILSEGKADDFSLQYHRPFPMIKLEAQKDRQAAQQVRQGRRLRKPGRSLSVQ